MILLLFPLAGYAYTLVLRNGRPHRNSRPVRCKPVVADLRDSTWDVSLAANRYDRYRGDGTCEWRIAGHFLHASGRKRLNRWNRGSRLRRSQSRARSVTNQDLEKFQQERLKNDEIYDRDHQRRGLPSREELRRMEWDSEQKMKQVSKRG